MTELEFIEENKKLRKILEVRNITIKNLNQKIELLNNQIKIYENKPHKRYIIWNTKTKEHQFKDICTLTQKEANYMLYNKIGHDAKKWRFEIRAVLYDPITDSIKII